jgi:hypothetical protein
MTEVIRSNATCPILLQFRASAGALEFFILSYRASWPERSLSNRLLVWARVASLLCPEQASEDRRIMATRRKQHKTMPDRVLKAQALPDMKERAERVEDAPDREKP